MKNNFMNLLIDYSTKGLFFGITFMLTIVLGLIIIKATWQSGNPGGGTDTNLYLNGTGSLSAEKWNSLINKVNQAAPSNTIMAFNLTSCPTGRKPADGTNSTPDLRGVFLRGLNTFDNGTTTRSTLSGDSQSGRIIGSYQNDQFQGHKIRTSYTYGGAGAATAGVTFILNSSTANVDGIIIGDGTNGTPRTGSETRPRNVAVIFCMKN